MQQPYLRIFAGCNGSGKSTYSKIISSDTVPFDYDKRFLEYYKSMPDSELREQIAIHQTTEEFEMKANQAFNDNISFSFETNLYPYPENIISKAKEHGFRLEMYFFLFEYHKISKRTR
jgi:predicted ABC-type ATPase